MRLDRELLRQARRLAEREPGRPRQVDLRRAVSAAYYALFHLLTREASRRFVRDPRWVAVIDRTFNHGEMNRVSKDFMLHKFPKIFDPLKGNFGSQALLDRLANVARTFVELQRARHHADYDLTMMLNRNQALALVRQVEQAFLDWREIRTSDAAGVYLGSFGLRSAWDVQR